MTLAKPGLGTTVQGELRRVREVYKSFQATRHRDAVFDYLAAVLNLIVRWKRQGRLEQSLRQARQLQKQPVRLRSDDPFTHVIAFTSGADARTRSKWSRLLRWAEANLPQGMELAEFVGQFGGINLCAAKWNE